MFASQTKEPIDTRKHAKAATNHTDEDGRRIGRDARHAADHIRGNLDSLAHTVGEQMRKFVETAGEGLVQAKDSVSYVGGSVAAQIRRKPLHASAIALGVGVLLGAFLRRKA